MKFVIPEYNVSMDLCENRGNILIIENARVFSDVIFQIWNQINGMDGKIVLSEADQLFKISSKMELITNPFAVNCNDKKILSKIYGEITELSQENNVEEVGTLNAQLLTVLGHLLQTVPYTLDTDDALDITGLLKLYNVKVEEQEQDFLSHLVEYMKLKKKVCKVDTFILLNFKNYVSREELETFYETIFYEKINTLIISGADQHEHLSVENTLIIDQDLCMINP